MSTRKPKKRDKARSRKRPLAKASDADKTVELPPFDPIDVDLDAVALGHLAADPLIGGLLHDLLRLYGTESRCGTLWIDVTADGALHLRFEARGVNLDLPLLELLHCRQAARKASAPTLEQIGVDVPMDPICEPRWLHRASEEELQAHRRRATDFAFLVERELDRRRTLPPRPAVEEARKAARKAPVQGGTRSHDPR